MAIRLFASRILRGETIAVFGDGKSARDYTYIDDIVDGMAASVARCSGYEIVNIGGSKTTSLMELVKMLSARLDKHPVIKQMPDQPGDVPITYADVTKAKRLLDYAPQTDIVEGIDKFCTWLKAQPFDEIFGKKDRISSLPM
jgi:UDP-glucuronate 4-epimerase